MQQACGKAEAGAALGAPAVVTLSLDGLAVFAPAPQELAALTSTLSQSAQDKAPLVLRLGSSRALDGQDLSAMMSETAEPPAAGLLSQIEAHPAPVIAVIAGELVGFAAELALAADHRVVFPHGSLSFPMARYAMISGQGSSQRLPACLGVERSFHVLAKGGTLIASDLVGAGLAAPSDHGDLPDSLAALAVRKRGAPAPPDMALTQAALQRLRAEMSGRPERLRLLDCLEAAFLLPRAQGLGYEEAASHDLRSAPSRAAYCYGEAAWLALSAGDASPRPAPQLVGIAGASAFSAELALLALGSGLSVLLWDTAPAALDKVAEQIAARQTSLRAQGRLSAAALEHQIAALRLVAQPAPPEGPQFWLETRSGNSLSPIVGGAPVAMTLPQQLPSDLSPLYLGLYPAPAQARIIELRGGGSRLAEGFVQALGRPMLVSALQGLPISADLLQSYIGAGGDLLLSGHAPDAIDSAARAFGFRMGPLERADWLGVAQVPQRDLREGLLALGREGKLAGGGFYPAQGGQDLELEGLLARLRPAAEQDLGQIADYLNLSLALRAGALLDLDPELPPAALDLMAQQALGYPRAAGGPLYWADQFGLFRLAKRAEQLGLALPASWQSCVRLGTRLSAPA